MRLLGICCPDSYTALRPERNGAGDASTLTAHGPEAAVAPVRRPRRACDDRPLRARGRSRGRLRAPVALVGRRPRGLLGRDLGVLRRAGLRAVRARARTPGDAGRAVVPGIAAVLRRALLPRSRRRRGGDPPCQRAARAVAV